MRPRFSSAPFKLRDLLWGEFGVEFIAETREDLVLFLERQFVDLFQNLGRTHGLKIKRR